MSKDENTPMFIIKDFGNDTPCSSLEELHNSLFSKYNNRDIAVHDKREKLTKIRFVKVEKMKLYDSYTNEIISF